jgi:hypothetical protein
VKCSERAESAEEKIRARLCSLVNGLLMNTTLPRYGPRENLKVLLCRTSS